MAHRSRLRQALSGPSTFAIRGGNNRRVFRFRRLEFYAERGLIRVRDDRDGDYDIVSTQSFLLRAWHFNGSAGREKCPKERKELLDMVDAMMTCVRQARHQGDPNMPGVTQQMKYDKRKSSTLVNANIRPSRPASFEMNAPDPQYKIFEPA